MKLRTFKAFMSSIELSFVIAAQTYELTTAFIMKSFYVKFVAVSFYLTLLIQF